MYYIRNKRKSKKKKETSGRDRRTKRSFGGENQCRFLIWEEMAVKGVEIRIMPTEMDAARRRVVKPVEIKAAESPFRPYSIVR